MRSFAGMLLLAMVVGVLTPGIALCQLEDDFEDRMIDEDMPPPPPKATKQRPARKRWTDHPITWTIGAGVLAVAIPLGVFKTVCVMRATAENQSRPKAAWEGEPPAPPKK